MKWLLVGVVAIFLAFVPAIASAEDGKDEDNALIRINADVYIPAGESVGSLFVVKGNAVIDGDVTGSVFVVRGDAVVSGSVKDGLVVVSGNIDLRSGAQVNDVVSVRGDLIRADGVTVTGEITERNNVGLGYLRVAGVIFSFLFWVAISVALVVAGLVFAAIGGRQLTNAARAMTGEAVNTIVGVVFVWVALPIVAIIAMVTLIGIPLGVGMLAFVLPALGFLGYIVAGSRLGSAVVGRLGNQPGEHPYLATTVGISMLQALVLVPVLGAFVALVAGIWGAGALAYIAYRAAGGRSMDSGASAQMTPQGGAQVQPSA